jgi:hypothetical protein
MQALNNIAKELMIRMKVKKVKTSSLIIGLVVGFIFSIFLGITGVSMGLGSMYPGLNLITKPLLCPGQQMSYTQHVSEIGSDTFWSATWFCMDEGSETQLDPAVIHGYAGSLYGLLILILLLALTILYWNSSIGPAKNDGLRLW